MRYAKTEAGQLAFKTRSAQLTARQRSAFILFDGKKSAGEVLAMTAGLGVSHADVEHMLAYGFLQEVGASDPTSRSSRRSHSAAVEEVDQPVPEQPRLTPQERYARAWPIATQLTASLGLRGFKLNLAIEAAADYEGLRDLLPKIREAVGVEKVKPLEQALRE